MEKTQEVTENTKKSPCVVDNLSPFLKIPGGKRRLLPQLISALPEDFLTSDYTYVEPFLGGGALALRLLQIKPKLKTILNDKNAHIYNTWQVVKNDYWDLLFYLDEHISKHSKEHFYEVRNSLHSLHDLKPHSGVEIQSLNKVAAGFLYLNKNCYNGSIRFNRDGKFNSPLGDYKCAQTVDKFNLKNVSMALENSKISCKDFQTVVEELLKNSSRKWAKTLFYFDPPYIPLSDTSHFTWYTAGGFGMYDHYRLRNTIDYLTLMGAKVIASNSCSPMVRELYSKYNIQEVSVSRAINVKPSKRGKISEYLITNF